MIETEHHNLSRNKENMEQKKTLKRENSWKNATHISEYERQSTDQRGSDELRICGESGTTWSRSRSMMMWHRSHTRGHSRTMVVPGV